MKKKVLLAFMTFALLLTVSACGNTEKSVAESTEVPTVEVVPTSTEAPTVEVVPTSTEAPETESTATADSLDKEYTDMAESILSAVASKDLEALADLVTFPTAVNDEVVETREDFIALGTDTIFTEDLVNNMAQVEVADLILVKAGVVLGDEKPFIIFNLDSNNVLGITGMGTAK